MPRKTTPRETEQKLAQNAAMWAIFGKKTTVLVSGWDPKQIQLVDALLSIVASGSTVVLRPGSGGGAVGIAIWEGDTRHPAVWCYTSEEMDEWSGTVLEALKVVRGE